MVSHPETGSDSPIGSDRDRGRDTFQPNKRKYYESLGENTHNSMPSIEQPP